MFSEKIFLIPVISFSLLFVQISSAQIFDNPTNLQVLPKDISTAELRDSMKAMSLGTGFRCSSCHVGEEGQPLPEYDFVSDEKELKSKARLMLGMVDAINNSHLAPLGADHVKVQCVTCHRGVNKPLMTADVLTMAADEGGAEKMIAEYLALREKYYGTHSYDFSEFTMSQFAQSRAAAGEYEQARAILDIMLDENQESFMAHLMYGELEQRSGNNAEATSHYLKAIEINPRAQGFLGPRLEKLQAGSE